MDNKIKEIEDLLDEYIDVPTYSHFYNYKLNIGGIECYNRLVQELEKLIIKNKQNNT